MGTGTRSSEEANTTFIVIDDDPLNNKICGMFIRKILPDAEIETFLDPLLGIAHILALSSVPQSVKKILFLDINMPGTDGWQVLDAIKSTFTETNLPVLIYMLSSSVNPQDSQKARDPFITGYIEKPLSVAKLKAII
jgi:CheY-like chemotaxis protein